MIAVLRSARRLFLRRHLALALVLLVFAVGIALGLATLRGSSERVERLLGENHVWAATEAHGELARLENALVRLGAEPSAAAADTVRVRLDIVWSRLSVLETGETASFLVDHGLSAAIADLRDTLVSLDELLPALTAPTDSGFETALARAQQLLQSRIGPVRQWSLDVLHADRAHLLSYVRQRTEAMWSILATIGVLAATGLGFAAFLFVEMRAGRRQAEEAEAARRKAAAAEQRLMDAIEAVPEGFALYDADDRLVLCNERYREMYSMSVPAIRPGNSFEQIVRYGAERGQYAEAVGRVDDWVAERVQRHRTPGPPIEQPLGNQRWLRIEERPTSEGGIVGVRVDITDIKRAQTLLMRAERAANLGHFSIDTGSGRLVWSDQAARLLGLPRSTEAMDEASLLACFDVPARRTLAGRLARARLGDESFDGILRTVPIGGSAKWLAVRLCCERDVDGHLHEVFGTLQDVTEKHEAEVGLEKAIVEARAANEAKSRFLSIMSHEVRTPLNGVSGALNLIDESRLDPPEARMVALARSSANRLRTVVDDILDFSRIETGRLELDPAPFDPRAFLDEAAAFWRPQAMHKGLSLEADAAAGLARFLTGDAVRLRQILDNLINNALKYTNRGSVKIIMTAIPVDADENDGQARQILEISVADTGCGIAVEDRDRVFVDFSQLHSRDRLTIGGSGLGLAICKRLTALMGGTIGFDSRPGEGSTFRIAVPLPVAAAAPEPAFRTAVDEGITGLPPGTRVLVAEDNAVNRTIAEHVLTRLGCSVDLVHDGRAVCAAVGRKTYDVVLMDISMPGLDGIAATQLIRAEHGDQAPPILAYTAHAMPEERQRFLDAGMAGLVSKPVRTADLVRNLRAVISSSAAEGLPCEAEGSEGPGAIAPLSSRPEAAGAPPQPKEASDASTLLFDRATLETLRQSLSPATFAQLCRQFHTDVSRCLAEIDQAIAAVDIPALDRASHSLSSVAETLGAEALAAAARAFNAACRTLEAGPSPHLVDTLRQATSETLRCFAGCILASEPCARPILGCPACQDPVGTVTEVHAP